MTYFLDAFTLMSPTWVIEDILVYLLAGAVFYYLLRRRPRQAPSLFLELVAFTFVYASVYENFAVALAHYYSYGPSLIMVGNVPLSIPVFEALVFIGGLMLLERMRVPVWFQPIFVGFFAILQDLSLDPLAVNQAASVGDSVSARWQWLILKPGMAGMFGEPVMNWIGWVVMIGFAAAATLLGRWWYKKSGWNPVVGVVYPFLAMLVALVLLFSPVSQFLIWLYPFFAQGGASEWVMFGVYLVVPLLLLLFVWRGRMTGPLPLRDYWPAFAIFIGFHASDIAFTLIGGYRNVLWIVLAASVVHTLILLAIYLAGRRATPARQPVAIEDAAPAEPAIAEPVA